MKKRGFNTFNVMTHTAFGENPNNKSQIMILCGKKMKLLNLREASKPRNFFPEIKFRLRVRFASLGP